MTKKTAIVFTSFILVLVIVNLYLLLAKKTSVSLQQNQPAQEFSVAPVSSWKTYINKDFNFQYPANWQLITGEVNLSNLRLKTETLFDQLPTASSSGQNAVSINIQNGKILDQNNKSLDFNSLVNQKFVETRFTGPKKIKLGDRDVVAYINKETGIMTNYLTIVYDGGFENYYELTFDYGSNSNLDYKSLFDQIINSFKFVYEK